MGREIDVKLFVCCVYKFVGVVDLLYILLRYDLYNDLNGFFVEVYCVYYDDVLIFEGILVMKIM